MKSSTHRHDLIRGWSASGDLFASVLAGLLIGLGLDAVFGTSPAFVIVFIVVAAIGGFLRMYSESEELEEQAREAIRIRDGI
ncbi:MAG: AtpZ/AtpI family protein [Actinomycetia bacterium]|nr:AtpZ/AtpI family protein [Actinomycetes bacterium]